MRILSVDAPRGRDKQAELALAQNDTILSMLSIDHEGIDSRYDARFPEIPGAKRFDASAACVAKGLWTAARACALAGAKWRFGAQTASKMTSKEDSDQAEAFYESLKIHFACKPDPIPSRSSPRL